MSIVITNRAPAPQTVGGVKAPVRFSLQDAAAEIDRSKINCYLGTGPAFYPGRVLPEDVEGVDFALEARSGAPANPATLSMVGDELKVEKLLAATNQEGVFFFGGLQAPADPDAPIMVEFTLRLAFADVGFSGDDTGVKVGLLINNTGIVIGFQYSTGDYLVTAEHATLAGGIVDSGVYNWDQTQPHTYKLLWDPRRNLVKLYVSTGQDSLVPDILLIVASVTDFDPIPVGEQRSNQPWMFFGHALTAATSTSYWSNAYLYNITKSPILEGVTTGEHIGFLRTDNQTVYMPDSLPKDAGLAWNDIPSSYDTIAGRGFLEDQKLILRKETTVGSFGYFRDEPIVATSTTIVDFTISGELLKGDTDTVSTGMEIYVDDGSVAVRVALLNDDGSQYIGILKNGDSTFLASYEVRTSGWGREKTFRLIYEPGVSARLFQVAEGVEGVDESLLVEVSSADLPASSMPGPGIGVLHNGLVAEAQALLKISKIRYQTNVTYVEGDTLPLLIDFWDNVKSGGNLEPTTDGEVITILDTAAGTGVNYYYNNALLLDSEDGISLEFRARVNSYEADGVVGKVGACTGVTLSIDDGTGILALVFADGGPVLGKIAFLLTDGARQISQNLTDIRAGLVADTFFAVDWTQYHLYRIERVPDGSICVYVDEEAEPSLELDEATFSYAPTDEGYLIFGSAVSAQADVAQDYKNSSSWKLLRYSISKGYDISLLPTLSENEYLSRFNHAVNVLVEADN